MKQTMQQTEKKKPGRKPKQATIESLPVPAEDTINHIFVFGALMSGKPFNQILEKATYVGPAYIPFTKIGQHSAVPFPALIPDLGSIAKGELYALPQNQQERADLLAKIDSIEGTESGLYHREKLHSLTIYTDNDKVTMELVVAYCYLTAHFEQPNLYDFSSLTMKIEEESNAKGN